MNDDWSIIRDILIRKMLSFEKQKCFITLSWTAFQNLKQLVQLERLRSKDTRTAPWLPILLSSFIGSQAYIIEQFILDPKSKHDKV